MQSGETQSTRRYPFPYQALLAISSDLDRTPDWSSYYELLRFLNTRAFTRYGQGVGLEFANSIYFHAYPEHFSFFNAAPAERESLQALIESGHVDTVHSFGDLARTRKAAGDALGELSKLSRTIPVWVDHAQAPTNFGQYHMVGRGDIPGHEAYHADLTLSYGIDYCWRGQITSVVGQDAPRLAFGQASPRLVRLSGWKMAAKESVKSLSGKLGFGRYRMHGDNRVIRPVRLRDGQQTREFLRSNASRHGIERGDCADTFAELLSEEHLRTLIDRRGVAILYTHLGIRMPLAGEPGNRELLTAFERVQDLQTRGELLVLTTARALDYLTVRDSAHVRRDISNGVERLHIDRAAEDRTIKHAWERTKGAGLTFYVHTPGPHEVLIAGRPMAGLTVNPPDETGRRSVSVPLTRMDLPTM